jgi:Mg-chelatase subunit ChlD
MAAELRRPADYGLVMSFSEGSAQAAEPGSVHVVSDPSGAPGPVDEDEPTRARSSPDVAVELVLDTSGSMLERIGRRRRRIDVAKDVLARLVTERLAPGTPVALRVFRQDGPGCETELAVPLGPLDPAAMEGTIGGLSVRKGVATPLAAAIEAVASDLGAVTGPRIVVVVSDGEESCDGDPEAAVRALVDQGFDVSVNVVGLDLDRKARRKVERLAEIGNGTYFDARDADGLSAALKAALGAPYVVVDGAGTEVARGTIDGDAIELPPGTYRIEILGAANSLDVVVVEPGRETTVVARPNAG